jgi:predicted ATP-grasp superfamily ATP-dependent carboligase
MIQRLITGGPKNLYSFCSFFKDGIVYEKCVARRIRQRPMDFGRATTYAETVDAPLLEDLGKRFLAAINYYGLSEIEFMFDHLDNQYKLLEINARTWKWHTLALRAGVNFPLALYKDACGLKLEINPTYKIGAKWVDVITDIEIVVSEALKGNITLQEYLSSMKGEKEHAVFSKDDPLPFLTEIVMLPYLWWVR